MTSREHLLAKLRARTCDVLVIGGGIVGASIARDAAMRGLSVSLIEQGDFASGTSSKTSKLIHGGLRYLEHGHLRLVFESLRERHAMRTIAPGYVRPLSLLLPIYQGDSRPAWKIRAGLWLYDWLAWGHALRGHRVLSAVHAREFEPRLEMNELQAVGLYTDCLMDDARICLAAILQATQFSAVCANYVRLRALLRVRGRVCGGAVEDVLSGRTFELHAAVVVNATGPWADQIRRLDDREATRCLAPTKGIHVIVPRVSHQALFVEAKRDRRMFFILPWGEDYSLLGTTESPVDGPLEALTARADEVGYLLEETNRVLQSCLHDDDVVATYAGARPLLAFGGNATQASREHRIEIAASGLISIMGGKYTTARLMAEQVVDAILAQRRWTTERCLTDQISLLELAHPMTLEHWRDVTRAVDPDLLARLLVRYGTGAFAIIKLLDHDETLARPICPHHELIEAELVHALRHEFAWTLTDVLARRTRIAWSSCQGLDALSTLTDLAARYSGYPAPLLERQAEDYHQFLARSLAFHPVLTPSTAPF